MTDGQADARGGSTTMRRAAPPTGFLGMFLLVVLAEWTLSGHDLNFTAPWHWDWRTTGKLAARKQGKADVLLFGDSVLKFGVMPKVLSDRSGRTAYNFALHTGQTSSSYFLLRRVLAAGYRPQLAILDLTPHMFAHDAEANLRLWPELLTPGECLDLAWTMRQPDFFAQTVLAACVPSIKERLDIRPWVYSQLTGAPCRNWRGEIPRYRRNWRVNDGGQLMPDGASPPIDPVYWEQSLYPRWNPDPVNVAYLDRFLAAAAAAHVPVAWLLPPIQPSVQVRTEASGFDAAYTQFVQQVSDRFPGVTVVDARHSGFEPSDFDDGIHLKRPGALRISVALGDLLRSGLNGRRWVQLDAARSRGVAIPAEDVTQSAIALEASQVGVKR